MKPKSLFHELFTVGLFAVVVGGCVLFHQAHPDSELVSQDLDAHLRWVNEHCPQAADHVAFRYPVRRTLSETGRPKNQSGDSYACRPYAMTLERR